MKQGIINDYGAKGQNIVDMNVAAVLAGQTAAKEVSVPASWANAQDGEKPVLQLNTVNAEQDAYVRNILIPTNPGGRRAACLRFPALCHRQSALRHGRL